MSGTAVHASALLFRKSVRVEVLEEQKRKRKRENDKIAANMNVKRKPNCKYHSEDYKVSLL